MTLQTQSIDRSENARLLASITHDEAQFVDLATGFAGQLDDLVNQNDRKIVDHEPTHVFKVVCRLRSATT
jgi:hypothetical protein